MFNKTTSSRDDELERNDQEFLSEIHARIIVCLVITVGSVGIRIIIARAASAFVSELRKKKRAQRNLDQEKGKNEVSSKRSLSKSMGGQRSLARKLVLVECRTLLSPVPDMLARLVSFLALLAVLILASPAHTGLFRQARADAQAYDGAYDNTFYRGYGSQGMNMRFEGQGNNWY